MYKLVKGPVPEGEYTIPLGVADIKREGTDITLIATSSMVYAALDAAKMLEEIGIGGDLARRPRLIVGLQVVQHLCSARRADHWALPLDVMPSPSR